MTMPSGMATAPARANPRVTRRKLPHALRTRASSKCRTGKARSTSVGEGRMMVGTMLPYESTHHTTMKVASPATARSFEVRRVTGSRTFIAAGVYCT